MLNPSNQTNAGFLPFAGSLPENTQSFYQTMAKTTDSGLTYNVSAPATRKRSRDSISNQFYAVPNFPGKQTGASRLPPFAVGEDQFMRYQCEIDSIISQHTKKIRLEIEERQKEQARLLISALGEGVMRKLKEKDDQIQRIGKLNIALQEKVRSVFLENQLWRDLAQSNEATVNSLRTNLEQVLMQVGGGGGGDERVSAGAEEDAESCCASSDDRDVADGGDDGGGSGCSTERKCRLCGERESCVLLLPCRHLCLCGVCGSGSRQLQACPVCNASMNATLHVNLSSS